MTGNAGAWGIAMWKDGRGTELLFPQEDGISLEGGDEIIPFLPTEPLGCLLAPPDGMGVPPVRIGDVAFAQRDGVIQFGDYYEPRQITLEAILKNDDCPGCPQVRQRVSRLTEEWSRNCDGATLVLFTDCHDPEATEEEKVYLGPYMVHGRPRVAEVTWLRSNLGAARVTLRFDAEDARLELASTDPGAFWTSEHTVDAPAGADGGGNLSPDYRLDGLSMSLNGATVQDTHLSGGAPDGGSYFQRIIVSPNTTSPMAMPLTGTGTAAIPVDPADVLSVAFWARKSPGGGPDARVDYSWYTGAGALITAHTGTPHSTTDEWQRFTEEGIVAPALAEFLQVRLVWAGTALAGQTLDFAQGWVNEGATATEPAEIVVVGTLCVYVTFTLFGTLTAPITVNYGPYQFTYDEDVTTNNVTIDTRWGRAADITVDSTQFLSGNYTSPLGPGTYDFSVTTGDPADDGSVRATWSNAVVSG